jgi:hypothetical protein
MHCGDGEVNYFVSDNWKSVFLYGVVFCKQILRCISQLELAQLIGTGVKPKRITKDADTHHPIEAFDPEGEDIG